MMFSLLLISVMLTSCPAQTIPTDTRSRSNWPLICCLCSTGTRLQYRRLSRRNRGCRKSSTSATRMLHRLLTVLPTASLRKRRSMQALCHQRLCSKRSKGQQGRRIRRLRRGRRRHRRRRWLMRIWPVGSGIGESKSRGCSRTIQS